MGPCPSCAAERSDKDPRPPVLMKNFGNKIRFKCFVCKWWGDEHDLAKTAKITTGDIEVLRSSGTSLVWPDPGTVVSFLVGCRPVGKSQAVQTYLKDRGIQSPNRAPCGERFYHHGKFWPTPRLAWRMAVPLFDGSGVMRSVHARNLTGQHPKVLTPRGYRSYGLMMISKSGRVRLLNGTPTRWLVVEGLTDYLAACSHYLRDDEPRCAVIGLTSFSKPTKLPGRVTILTHSDPTGEEYRGKWAELNPGSRQRECRNKDLLDDLAEGYDPLKDRL